MGLRINGLVIMYRMGTENVRGMGLEWRKLQIESSSILKSALGNQLLKVQWLSS
jgi:hypothetical protein